MSPHEISNTLMLKVASVATGTTSGLAAFATENWSLAIFGVPISVLLAGFAGAMVSLSFLPPEQKHKWWVIVTVSTIIAGYSQPLAAYYFNVPTHLALGLAFFLGLTVQVVIPLVLKHLPDFIKRKMGGGE